MLKIKNTKNILSAFIAFASIFSSFSINAGGIALGATRIIYPAESKQESISITNSDNSKKYLVQSWVEDENGQKTSDFIITPPLFVSKPNGENTLRIIYTANKPTNKESLYWLNSKSIPAVDSNSIENKNVLQIAIISRIKLFVRPLNLEITPSQAYENLTFTRDGDLLTINNPSPYYITVVHFYIGKNKLENIMLPPEKKSTIKLPSGIHDKVITWKLINDFGANTPTYSYTLK